MYTILAQQEIVHNNGTLWHLLHPHGTCETVAPSYGAAVAHIGSCLETDKLVSADLLQ